MQIHHTIASLRAALKAARTSRPDYRVAMTPTMGNLHDGHIDLMTRAGQQADCVVASIFVNRLQFRPGEDFEKYPRTFAADCARMEAAGVQHVFAPDENEMYPQPQGYHVLPPEAHDRILEGEFRPGHFRGVATVVLKLFQIAQPDVALFGKKDYQQLMVIRQMTADLNVPVEIVGVDTVRAADGLALSSRNGYLNEAERAEAPRLYRLLREMRQGLLAGNQDFSALEARALGELQAHGWQPDYLTIRRRADLQPPNPDEMADTPLVILAAAKLGNTRLIDNLEV